jgi:hypothetical protein
MISVFKLFSRQSNKVKKYFRSEIKFILVLCTDGLQNKDLDCLCSAADPGHFWYGSGSRFADPHLRLTDPAPDPAFF